MISFLEKTRTPRKEGLETPATHDEVPVTSASYVRYSIVSNIPAWGASKVPMTRVWRRVKLKMMRIMHAQCRGAKAGEAVPRHGRERLDQVYNTSLPEGQVGVVVVADQSLYEV